jgi:hypothetical protein
LGVTVKGRRACDDGRARKHGIDNTPQCTRVQLSQQRSRRGHGMESGKQLNEGDWETDDLKPRPCMALQEVKFTEKFTENSKMGGRAVGVREGEEEKVVGE